MQELASQAASRAKAEAAKNITPPNSAYQFEVSWRGLSGDRALQVRLLRVSSGVSVSNIGEIHVSITTLIHLQHVESLGILLN